MSITIALAAGKLIVGALVLLAVLLWDNHDQEKRKRRLSAWRKKK